MRWVLPREDDFAAHDLARSFDLHPVAARVLVSRGYRESSAVDAFLRTDLSDLPDPFSMLGMDRAADRLLRAVVGRERIMLYGDYDVDGVSATSLLLGVLGEIGADVDFYIPNRITEGYGLNPEAVGRIAASGSRLLVTLDCGISSVEEIDRAVATGLDVVVVDHHQVGESLPRAAAILNPHQPGCGYASKHLCATGVAFNLAMALRRRLRDAGRFTGAREPNLRSYLDLVALATVADVVPILGVNRSLVRHGLAELARAERPGIQALKEVAGLAPRAPVTTGQVGFRLGPRLNAAGRLDDASLGVKLLCARTIDEARPLAQLLDGANAERQAIERRILAEACDDARDQVDRRRARGLVLAREGWHVGVIGIVASRVVERFHRPAVLIGLTDGVGRGSARSVEGFALNEAFRACAGRLTRYGGHKHAAGLTLPAANLEAFRADFERIAAEALAEEDLVPRCRIDARLEPTEIDEALVAGLDRLGPFGNSNPEPVLALTGIRGSPRVLPSRNSGPSHLKLRLTAAPSLDAIGFGMGDEAAATHGPFDAAFAVGIDEWNGRRRVQLKLKAIREHLTPPSPLP